MKASGKIHSRHKELNWFRALAALILTLGVNAGSVAWAHDPGLSLATACLKDGTLSIDLALARSDVERLVELDANHDGQISDEEFNAARRRLERKATEAFFFNCAGHRLEGLGASVKMDNLEGVHFRITFPGATGGELSIHSALLEDLPRGHRQFFTLRDGKQNRLCERMLDASHPSLTLQLIRDAPPAPGPDSFRTFVKLGVEHIATGYDHLLFLLGLLLVGGSLRSALKVITSFTVAHSITLALATLNVVNISPRVIEPLIAASIVYVGLENMLRKGVENRWLLTFCFGLVHGCGFASALRELGVGANGTSIAIPLISFNLGVEIGQLAIAAVALPLIWKCRSSTLFVQRGVPLGSAAIVMAGSYWLFERTMV